jgi:Family of unknown function (DUF6498)
MISSSPGDPMAFARWVHRAFLVSTNLVPLAGVLWFGWSASTFLIVFWADTLFTGTANVVRIALHRKLTRTRGHWRRQLNDSYKTRFGTKGWERRSREPGPEPEPEPEAETTFLAEYAVMLYVFTLAHGLFLGVFLVLIQQNWQGEGPSPWAIDPASLKNGLLAVGGLTVFELLYDLLSLGRQPFSWLKARVEVALARVVILHFVIIFGAFLMMRYETPMGFLGILVALKTLLDLGASDAPLKMPEKPPRWLASFGRKQGLDMELEWRNMLAEQVRQAEEDETTI